MFGRLRRKLLIVLLIVGFASLIPAAAVNYFISTRGLTDEVREKLASVPGPLGFRVDRLLYFRWNDVLEDSHLPLFRSSGNREAQTDYLVRRKLLYHPYAWIGATDTSGRVVAATDNATLGMDVSAENWFVGARAIDAEKWDDPRAGVHVTDAAIDPRFGPVVGFSSPIYDPAGRFMGVIHSAVQLGFVADLMKDIDIGRSGQILLVKSDGAIIVDSGVVAPADGLRAEKLEAFAKAAQGGQGIVEEPNLQGVDSLVAYAPLRGFQHYPGTDWVLLAVQTTEEAFEPIAAQAQAVTLMALGGIALIFVIGALFARQITRPIDELREGTDRIGAGDLSYRISISTGDEIEALAESFNRMTASVAEAYREQRSIADTLQRALISRLPDIPNLDLGAFYSSATSGAHVGGDFYDAFTRPDGRIALVIGDVCGKGVAAASVTLAVKSMVRGLSGESLSADALLSRLNQWLEDQLREDEDSFVTLLYGVYDLEAGVFEYAAAGHPYPVPSDGQPDTSVQGAPPLGVLPNAVYRQNSIRLRPGDSMALFTDGLVECRLLEGALDEAGVREVLRANGGLPAQELAEKLYQACTERCPALSDDVAVLALRRKQSGSSTAPESAG